MRMPKKAEFPLSEVRRYLEPGPVVLVSSVHKGQTNIMTMGWHTMMEFTPALVGCVIAESNHSRSNSFARAANGVHQPADRRHGQDGRRYRQHDRRRDRQV